jgi:hypothetical protein
VPSRGDGYGCPMGVLQRGPLNQGVLRDDLQSAFYIGMSLGVSPGVFVKAVLLGCSFTVPLGVSSSPFTC